MKRSRVKKGEGAAEREKKVSKAVWPFFSFSMPFFFARFSTPWSARYRNSTLPAMSSEYGASRRRCREFERGAGRDKRRARSASSRACMRNIRAPFFSSSALSFFSLLLLSSPSSSPPSLTLPHPLDTGRHEVGPVLEQGVDLAAHGALGGVDVEGRLHGCGVDRRQRQSRGASGSGSGCGGGLERLLATPAGEVTGENRDATCGGHLALSRICC